MPRIEAATIHIRLAVCCSLLTLAFSYVNAQMPKTESAPLDCRVRAYGAIGDGTTLNTVAINAAIQDCASRGGGTVVIEAGTYRTGTVRLLDNITLKLEPGATLLGATTSPITRGWRALPRSVTPR